MVLDKCREGNSWCLTFAGRGKPWSLAGVGRGVYSARGQEGREGKWWC